jgi:hypothetical protein
MLAAPWIRHTDVGKQDDRQVGQTMIGATTG